MCRSWIWAIPRDVLYFEFPYPRPSTRRAATMSKDIYYSDKYEDDKFEYRHVMLPKVPRFL